MDPASYSIIFLLLSIPNVLGRFERGIIIIIISSAKAFRMKFLHMKSSSDHLFISLVFSSATGLTDVVVYAAFFNVKIEEHLLLPSFKMKSFKFEVLVLIDLGGSRGILLNLHSGRGHKTENRLKIVRDCTSKSDSREMEIVMKEALGLSYELGRSL